MDEQFIRGRVVEVRALADKADPFTRRRLLALANRYERDLPAARSLPKRPEQVMPGQAPR